MLGLGCCGALLLRVPPGAQGQGGSGGRSRRGQCRGGTDRRERAAAGGTFPAAAPVAHRSGAEFRSAAPFPSSPCGPPFSSGPVAAVSVSPRSAAPSAESGSIRAPGVAAAGSPRPARAGPTALGGGKAELGPAGWREAGGGRGRYRGRSWRESPFGEWGRASPRVPAPLSGVSLSRRCSHGQVQEPHHAQPV